MLFLLSETELYTHSVLTGQCVGITESFGIGTRVVGDGEQILCLKIYSCIRQLKLAAQRGRKRITYGKCLHAQERTVFDVKFRNLMLVVLLSVVGAGVSQL